MAALNADDFQFPGAQNPDYGKGSTRRRVMLSGEPGQVIADLCDPFHEMQCVLQHANGVITSIGGAMPRNPTTVCSGAIANIQQLHGAPLDVTPASIGGGSARQQCTHLLDLAFLAIAHARRVTGNREIIAEVPDETDQPIEIEVVVDGVIAHRWRVRSGHIVSPAALADRPLFAGFHRWAAAVFDPDALEAATVLERTYLISRGRRFLFSASRAGSLANNTAQLGSCYAYQPARAAVATYRHDNYRDDPF